MSWSLFTRLYDRIKERVRHWWATNRAESLIAQAIETDLEFPLGGVQIALAIRTASTHYGEEATRAALRRIGFPHA